jgi:hypothetical protein
LVKTFSHDLAAIKSNKALFHQSCDNADGAVSENVVLPQSHKAAVNRRGYFWMKFVENDDNTFAHVWRTNKGSYNDTLIKLQINLQLSNCSIQNYCLQHVWTDLCCQSLHKHIRPVNLQQTSRTSHGVVSGYNGVDLASVRNREMARTWSEKQGGCYKYSLVEPQLARWKHSNW